MSDPRNPATPSTRPATRPRTRKSARQAAGTTAPVIASAGETAKTGSTAGAKAVEMTPIDRGAMIATAAYFRAASRRFEPGHELEDWLSAEREIDALLSQPTQSRQ